MLTVSFGRHGKVERDLGKEVGDKILEPGPLDVAYGFAKGCCESWAWRVEALGGEVPVAPLV